MSQTGDQMELREDDIRGHYAAAAALLAGFDHTPRLAKAREVAPPSGRSPGIAGHRMFRPTTPGLVTRSIARPEGVQLIERIEATGGDDPITSPVQATVLQALRRALAIALAVARAYADRTALTEMKADSLAARLSGQKAADFAELLTAEGLVAMGTFANALAFLLAPQAQGAAVEIGPVEEVTGDAQQGLRGVLWELDQDLALLATDEASLVGVTLAFAEQLMDKVRLRAETTPRLEPFTAATYHVAADDLPISGFHPAHRARGTTLTMAFKKPSEVIGNHIAKYQAMKLARMIMAYDFDRRLNPFVETGGFIFTFMGDGAPGTGKTTLIQMMAGLVAGYCEVAGYPFRYQNFSIDQIDSYQGKSAQNAKAFVTSVLDPAVIGFGTIDDIDQIAGKRGDRQSSAGQQEVTAVFMEAFAGANTVVRGNCTFGMFSNYPENVDDALRQRAGARFLVDGPQSREDYIDILGLLLGQSPIPVGDHALYAAQELKRAVAASFQGHARPHEDGLLHVWQRTEAELGPLDTLAKLGTYLKHIQEADPRFTGRAIRNITDAVKVRAMDFEIPDDWMEAPDLFLKKPYEQKLAMLKDMAQPITPEMVVQEINRYADSEFRYADKSDAAAIDTLVRDMGRMDQARRRYAKDVG